MSPRLPLFRILAALPVLLVAAACSTMALLGADSLTFSRDQLQEKLVRSFPREYQRLGGLVSLGLMNPRLSIPMDAQRLRLDVDVDVGALGRGDGQADGTLTLTSALRYDPAAHALYLADPRLEDVRIASTAGGRMNDTIRGALNDWLADWARREPVYRFDDSLIGRIGARRVKGTTIQNGQVVVDLDG